MSLGSFLRRISTDQYVVLAIIVLYVAIASVRLGLPGVHYDEALYLNAALGAVDSTTFVTKLFHGVPVLLMPYIGALKAYVFYPIFALFGVNAVSMRLPSLLLSGAGLWLLYMLVRKPVGRLLGISIVAVTALNASFLVFTRLDFGPVVLDFLLKVLALVVLLRFVQSPRMRWMIAFWVIMFLGVFNKLNYVWYVNAFLAAFLALYGRQLWERSNGALRKRFAAIIALGYGLCVGYYMLINAVYHLGGSLGFVGFKLFFANLSTLVSGSWFYNYAFSSKPVGTEVVFWLMVAVILSGAGCLAWTIRRQPKQWNEQSRFAAFMGLLLLLLLAQIAMTLKATAGWHYFSVYPFFGIVFVGGLSYTAHFLWPRRKRLVAVVVAGVVGLTCLYQLGVYRAYIAAYSQQPSNLGWSTAIFDLAVFTKAHHGTFVSLNWGTQTQLVGLGSQTNTYVEVTGPLQLADPVQNAWLFKTYITDLPGAYYITYAPGANVVPQTNDNFFSLAEQHGYHRHRVAVVRDHSTAIYEIYQLNQ